MATFFINKIHKDPIVERRMDDAAWDQFVKMCIGRYATCDWGSVSESIKDLNDDAVACGKGMILAMYLVPELLKSKMAFSQPVTYLWITTSADHTQGAVVFMPELI